MTDHNHKGCCHHGHTAVNAGETSVVDPVCGMKAIRKRKKKRI